MSKAVGAPSQGSGLPPQSGPAPRRPPSQMNLSPPPPTWLAGATHASAAHGEDLSACTHTHPQRPPPLQLHPTLDYRQRTRRFTRSARAAVAAKKATSASSHLARHRHNSQRSALHLIQIGPPLVSKSDPYLIQFGIAHTCWGGGGGISIWPRAGSWHGSDAAHAGRKGWPRLRGLGRATTGSAAAS